MPTSASTISGGSLRIRSIACRPSPTTATVTSSSAKVSSMTRWMVTLSSARRSLSGMDLNVLDARPDVRRDEVDDLLHGCARKEDALHAHFAQPGNIHVR